MQVLQDLFQLMTQCYERIPSQRKDIIGLKLFAEKTAKICCPNKSQVKLGLIVDPVIEAIARLEF